MITLALDLAGSTGYAIDYGDELVKVGLWSLTRGLDGSPRNPLPMYRLWKRLNKLSETHDIGKIVFEEAFAKGAARYRLDSLQHATILWAMLNDILWMRVSPTAWKKRMLGNGQASKQQYYEAAVVRWPELRIWSDDQAAALWILAYERSW